MSAIQQQQQATIVACLILTVNGEMAVIPGDDKHQRTSSITKLAFLLTALNSLSLSNTIKRNIASLSPFLIKIKRNNILGLTSVSNCKYTARDKVRGVCRIISISMAVLPSNLRERRRRYICTLNHRLFPRCRPNPVLRDIVPYKI